MNVKFEANATHVECPHGFACRQLGQDGPCRVCYWVGGFVCLEGPRNPPCPRGVVFGDLLFCRCPLRRPAPGSPEGQEKP